MPTKNPKTRSNYRTGMCFPKCECLSCRREKAEKEKKKTKEPSNV